MPQRDIYHSAVKQALIKDGWAITHDPYTIAFGIHHGFVDLGAERIIAAEKDKQKIAVEIKSFISKSVIADLEQALGQYLLYRSWMMRTEPDRDLFLAISNEVVADIFEDIAGRVLIEDYNIRYLTVNMKQEEIVLWKS